MSLFSFPVAEAKDMEMRERSTFVGQKWAGLSSDEKIEYDEQAKKIGRLDFSDLNDGQKQSLANKSMRMILKEVGNVTE